MLEVGTGVGYLRKAWELACRFEGRGKPGEEESGSNAGRRAAAGRFLPATVGRVGSRALVADGEESMSEACHAVFMTIGVGGKLQEVRQQLEKCGPGVRAWWSRQNASKCGPSPLPGSSRLEPRLACKSGPC